MILTNRFSGFSQLKSSWPPSIYKERYTNGFVSYGSMGYKGSSTASVSSNESMTSEGHNKSRKLKLQQNQTCNLTHKILLALFVMLIFIFVIILSLPIKIHTDCDMNSLKFHVIFQLTGSSENIKCN